VALRFNFVAAAHPLVRLTPQFLRALHLELFTKPSELLAKVTYSVIPAKAGIQNCSKILDSGSRFACPE